MPPAPEQAARPAAATSAEGKGPPKYLRVAALVRGQIADGTLRPGEPAPSGAALSRVTGYSTLTCRRALRVLIAAGVLVPGPSANARPRVAGLPLLPAERDLAAASRALAAGLSGRRRGRGLTQPELASRVDVSVTTVGHAETGRLWQSRDFWERADAVLAANGDLLRLHDAFREAGAAGSAASCTEAAYHGTPEAAVTQGTGHGHAADLRGVPLPREQAADQRVTLAAGRGLGQRGQPSRQGAQATGGPGDDVTGPPPRAPLPPAAQGQAAPACVTIVWGDGTVTTVRPPEAAP